MAQAKLCADDEYEEEDEEITHTFEGFKYPDKKLKEVKTIEEFHKRFNIGRLLGSGGDGDVYESSNKPWAAIKKIRLYQDDDTEYELMKARQERRLLSKANIANIYGIYYQEYFDSKRRCTMRYIYKIYDRLNWCLDDLIAAMKDIRMTEQQIMHVIYDVCKDLKALHRQGFMHLDIKPSNVLYCKNGTMKKKYKDAGTFKLIDFDGCIWNRTVDEDGNEIFDQGVEMGWQGTFCWTAPEMNDYVDDTNLVSYAADIWNVGLLILYMVHKGHLGMMDINDDDSNRFHQQYESCDALAIKGEIFDEWHEDKFGEDKLYQKEIQKLLDRGRISKELYGLLYNGIFVRDPEERYSIEEVLDHPWFNSYDNEYRFIELNGRSWDYYEALMHKDQSGNRIYNPRIRFMQSRLIPSDDEGSETENEENYKENREEHKGNSTETETETGIESEYFSDRENCDLQNMKNILNGNVQRHNLINNGNVPRQNMLNMEWQRRREIEEEKKSIPVLKNTTLKEPSFEFASGSGSNSLMKLIKLKAKSSSKLEEESPEIRFFSDEEDEDGDDERDEENGLPPIHSRYNSSDYTHSSAASGTESDDAASRQILRRFSASKPIIRRAYRRLSF